MSSIVTAMSQVAGIPSLSVVVMSSTVAAISQVAGIPSFIVVDAASGDVVCGQGDDMVRQDPEVRWGAGDEWGGGGE